MGDEVEILAVVVAVLAEHVLGDTAIDRREGRRVAEDVFPPWLVERGLDKNNLVAVHAGDCWTVAKSSRCVGVTRAQALDTLRQQVPACTQCGAETALGFME
ncbi:DUF6233 domain-containing protein [Streptomyces mirabilis]|uniref:DUF6233 domain-containing protein n=1 Tax=Streptomyces mirabilis TaxID=68239 RepID=UPI0033C7AB64